MLTFIRDLRLARKLQLLGLLAVVCSTVPLVLFLLAKEEEIGLSRMQLRGVQPAQAALEVVRHVQVHRGLSFNVLSGKGELEPQRAEAQAHAERAVQALERIVQAEVDDAALRSASGRLAAQWRGAAAAAAGRSTSPAESVARHTALVTAMLEFSDGMADHFGITLDPVAGTYFLGIGTLRDLPRLAEIVGLLRARGTLLLGQQGGTPEERALLASLADRAETALRDMELTLGKSFAHDAAIESAVGAATGAAAEEAKAVLKLVREQVLGASPPTLAPAAYFKTMTRVIETLFQLNGKAGATMGEALQLRLDAARRIELVTLGLVLAMMVLAAWLAFWIARDLTRHVRQAGEALDRIATGDLTVPVDRGSRARARDEMGLLLEAMGRMQHALVDVVGDVRRHADGVATASAQIAQGSADLSARTEQSATSLQQTAATMEQLGTTVSRNAQSSVEASRLAQAAREVAGRGGAVVDEVVQTMRGITESSRRIADIIGVIDGIAFQTNILALNAAVEAARAGDQGRGFAVVAGEVRNLAQRSADAAREIKSLITSSVERVEQGFVLAGQAGETMGEVVSSIQRVSGIVAEISHASAEQSSGVGQVGQAVSHLDQNTQQNSALVEESSAAAESLRQQAQQLVQTVAVFKLPGQAALAAA